jgi:hypothetical protein
LFAHHLLIIFVELGVFQDFGDCFAKDLDPFLGRTWRVMKVAPVIMKARFISSNLRSLSDLARIRFLADGRSADV